MSFDSFICIYGNDPLHSPKSKIKVTLEKIACMILFRHCSGKSIEMKDTDAQLTLDFKEDYQ